MALKWPSMCWCAVKKLLTHSLTERIEALFGEEMGPKERYVTWGSSSPRRGRGEIVLAVHLLAQLASLQIPLEYR